MSRGKAMRPGPALAAGPSAVPIGWLRAVCLGLAPPDRAAPADGGAAAGRAVLACVRGSPPATTWLTRWTDLGSGRASVLRTALLGRGSPWYGNFWPWMVVGASGSLGSTKLRNVE